MKYVLSIVAGAVVAGLLLYMAVDLLLGDWASAFFVKFLAVPIGLIVSLFFFLAYDHFWPKKKGLDAQGSVHRSDDS